MTSYRRRCDVITSHRRSYDVIISHVPAGYTRKYRLGNLWVHKNLVLRWLKMNAKLFLLFLLSFFIQSFIYFFIQRLNLVGMKAMVQSKTLNLNSHESLLSFSLIF